jgi:hypothetical protein
MPSTNEWDDDLKARLCELMAKGYNACIQHNPHHPKVNEWQDFRSAAEQHRVFYLARHHVRQQSRDY